MSPLDTDATLHVLLVEDKADDEELILRQLRRATPDVVHRRVADETGLRAALAGDDWDLVISDYVMPGFSGLAAIAVVRELRPDLPVILVSGTVGEDIAVDAVRAGADDYVMKGNLGRLNHAVERTLRYAAERRERAAEQAALAAAERRFEGVLDAVPTAIIVVDLDGLIVRTNGYVTEVFGYAPGELIGVPVERLLAEDLRPVHRDLRAAYAEDPAPRLMGRGREVDGLRADGTRVRIEVGLAPVIAGGEMLVVAAAHDITARLELEARLHQAEKMEALGRLTGGIAHDFNNLLTAINGYAELLSMDLPPGSTMREEVDQIRAAGERGAELVRYLLAFGRRQALQPQTIDVPETLVSLSPLLRRLVTETVDLVLDLDPSTPRIHCDRSQLERSLVNLIVNARDAMPDGGIVTIATRPEAGEGSGFCVVEVTDTGTGIADEILDNIFTPFFTTKPAGHGAGLGLASVHGFVTQSGGSIEVEGVSGGGARFRIRLPVAPPDAGDHSRPQVLPGQTIGAGETILVVEDESGVRAVIEASLARFGFRPIVAGGPADVERALATIETSPAVLVSDIVMPGLDGRTLATQLLERFPGIGVVLTSGYDPDADGTPTLDDIPGAVFLPKPFEPGALAAAVASVLAQRAG